MDAFSNEIYNAVLNTTVRYERFKQVIGEMKHLYELANDFRRSEGMLIMGPSGSGKSRLLERFSSNYPDVRKKTHMSRPVITVTMPPKPTEMALLYRIALAFGEQYASGRSYQLLARVINLLIQCETRILVIDEAHHLARRNNLKDAQLAADILKVIMDETKAGLILSGIPEVEEILLSNKQLRGRFTNSVMFEPWVVVSDTQNKERSDINAAHLQEFASIMISLIKGANYNGDSSLFTQPAVIRRIYFATDGRIRYMSRLVATVLAKAIPNEVPKLEMAHLHAAYTDGIHQRAKPESNPFDETFADRRLNLRGEPFWGDAE
jgi:energy-coupling factor transporter ATP-binding protein EcfA2